MIRTLTYCSVVCMVILAGCVEPESREDVIEPEPLQFSSTPFPYWSGFDHTNQSLNGTLWTNQTAFVAYFSAPWCTHCEPTIDAYDEVIPPGKMVVFSREGREEYSNMSEWHERTESNLNKSIERPFILLPSLAQTLDVQSIPHAIFINDQGLVYNVQIGKRTNLTAIAELWELTSAATFDESTGWSYYGETM